MGLFGGNNIISQAVKKPVNRIFAGGWEAMGAITRQPDTRTKEEIVQTIDYYTQHIPELKKFSDDIKSLNHKHMGTIADTLELSTHHEMLSSVVNLGAKKSNGVTYREAIIGDMIDASRSNPEAMELVDAIINNTDSITSKYSLAAMSEGVLKNKDVSKQMQETAKVIPDMARETLGGGYTMDYSQQHNFVEMLKTFVNQDAKPDKIVPLFKDLAPAVDKLPQNNNYNIYMNKFVNSEVPMKKVQENIEVLPEVVNLLGDKSKDIDVVDFVTKNTNLY